MNKLDLNLLKTLKVLLAEKHVGRSAKILNISQSAVSHSLARLREGLSDPLFIRTGKGLEPTNYASSIEPKLDHVFNEIAQMLLPESFEPGSYEGTFALMAPETFLETDLIDKLHQMQGEAPGVVFEINTIMKDRFDLVSSGRVDLLIGVTTGAPPHLRQQLLLEDELICLLSDRHPALDSWGAESFFSYPHVKVTFTCNADDPIDQYIRQRGLPTRKVGLLCDNVYSLPFLVENSNLITTVPKRLVDEHAKRYRLTEKACPLPVAPLQVKQIWHQRNHNNPFHRWVREKMAEGLYH